jgi:hypothetical protein
MPRLRNISPHELDVFRPAGEADTFHVAAGQEITVNGDLAAEQPADAYQIGEGDDARLWPHSVWALVQDTPPAAVPEPSISVPLPAAGEEH